MAGESRRPRLVLMCGLPASGKTTEAQRLERELVAIRLCPDEWLVDLGFRPTDESARARVEALQVALTRRLLSSGTSVILEAGFWTKAERDELRLMARDLDVGVELRFLDVPLATLLERLAGRTRQEQTLPKDVPVMTPEQLTEWAEQFEHPSSQELSLFDAF
jgi:predicted kinase